MVATGLAEETAIRGWTQLLRGEYLQIPGLQLTRSQVQHLWGLDPTTCDLVIESLVGAGFLTRTETGGYVRANGRSEH
jgi:hypothetical protein